MENLRWIVSALLLLVAIPSCGSGTGGGEASIPLAEFPAAYMDAVCSYMVRCGRMPDKATCEASILLDLPRQVAGADAGKINYDGKAAATCADAVSSLSCTYWDPLTSVAPEPCRQALQPLVINGGPCFIDAECISGQCKIAACSGGATCCPGTCVPSSTPAVTVGIGGDCLALGSVCIDGAFCFVVSYSGPPTCQPKAALGQPCGGAAVGESSCVEGATCALGTCVTVPAEGQTCDPHSGEVECDSRLDYCDDVTLKCVRKIPVGRACTGYNCVDYAVCDSTSTCVALGRVGEKCSSGVGCLGSLICYAATCIFPSSPAICE